MLALVAMPAAAHAQHSKLSLESIGPAGGNGACPPTWSAPLDAGKRVFITHARARSPSADTDSSLDLYSRTGGARRCSPPAPPGGNGAFPANFARARGGPARASSSRPTRSSWAADTDNSLDVYERASGTDDAGLDRARRRRQRRLRRASSPAPPPTASRVFFTTRGALVGSDTDQSLDVYERSSGVTTLVSTGPAGGNGPSGAEFARHHPTTARRSFFQTRRVAGRRRHRLGSRTSTSAPVAPPRWCRPARPAATAARTRTSTALAGRLEGLLPHRRVAGRPPTPTAGSDVYERSGGTTTIHSIGPGGGNGGSRASSWASPQDGTKSSSRRRRS